MIRPARLEDLEAIVALERSVPEVGHWPATAYGEMLQPQDGSAALQRRIYVDEEAGIRGFIVMTLLRHGDGGHAEIENLAVAATARRQGIARGLCRAAMQDARQAGLGGVELEVRATNAAAKTLYFGLGFETTGIRADYYTNPKEDACLLRVTLDAS